MRDDERQYFGEQLEQVMSQMPKMVHDLLERVPMYIEDHPSEKTMREMGIHHPSQLQGLYTGIPLTSRSVDQSGVLSDVIHIYRQGILAQATDHGGHVDETELRRQIRITVLHELGHHHGLDEDELRELGYG